MRPEKRSVEPSESSHAHASSTFWDSSDDEIGSLSSQRKQCPPMHAGQGPSPPAKASQSGVKKPSGAASLGSSHVASDIVVRMPPA
jgi:hypothetical protein